MTDFMIVGVSLVSLGVGFAAGGFVSLRAQNAGIFDTAKLDAEIDWLNVKCAALKVALDDRDEAIAALKADRDGRAELNGSLQAKLNAIADATRNTKNGTAKMVFRLTGRD